MEPLHVLRPSAMRRTMAFAVQLALGAMLLWLGFVHPPASAAWQVFLIGLGLATLVLAQKGWRGSMQGIALDADGLRQEDGRPIAPLADIASVDRALFSFKPSNGFVVRLRQPVGNAWVPGMWWRLGRRVGIGGVTGGAETRIMADALSAMVAERDARG
ncbi:hypothetical protein [Jannaschia rubra]|uniref:Uncharacterized protein n=1 Tax=Jannaschia rubra TaxID=282197 RepID=A0A0M6XUA7_9RHOB|nr:hypothetical protein [Jannaschia rubra]CTQ33801.1 hypothetical protein JAN5088_02587 [Jannaschia rubra]SFG09417.1 hypothetical protein SAMN04488517_102637 [Jannaschia rubra]